MKNSHNSEIINLLIQKKQSRFFFFKWMQYASVCFNV